MILSIKYIESPYFGGYYNTPPVFTIFLITYLNLLIYLFPKKQITLSEKIIFAALVATPILIFEYYILEKTLSIIFGYDENWDEPRSPRTLSDSLFYFLTTFSTIGLFAIAFKYMKSK